MITINNTIPGLIKNIEVKGNTYQDPNNLTKIISSGIDNGDGTYKMSILSVGENLFNKFKQDSGSSNNYFDSGFNEYVSSTRKGLEGFYAIINVNGGSAYVNFDKEGSVDVGYRYSDLIPSDFTSAVAGVSLIGAGYKDNTNKSKYLIITFRTLSEGVVAKIKNVDVKITTVATPYIPYEETRCDIKLPCQLEKWDRLYFDKEENAWCIDKNMDNGILNGKEPWTFRKTDVNTIMIDSGTTVIFPNSASKNNNSKNYFCNKLKSYSANELWSLDSEGIDIKQDGIIHIRLSKEKATDLESAKKWISENNFYLKYLSTTPKKIVLPQSEQIKLNSFVNKTHIYTISGDVDATVKATVSKSLASTVQANTNEINKINNTIADIQGMKESQDFAYETDKGYLVCKDTQNGVVKDLKIYGKSLVNRLDFNNTSVSSGVTHSNGVMTISNNTDWGSVRYNVDSLYPNSKYTLVINIFENTSGADIYYLNNNLDTSPFKNLQYLSTKGQSFIITKVETVDNLKDKYIGVRGNSNTGVVKLSYIILDGHIDDVENIQPFEGIASVGNGNEIEVLSVSKLIVLEQGSIDTQGNNIYSNLRIRSKDFISGYDIGGIDFSKYKTMLFGYDENKIFKEKNNSWNNAINKLSNDYPYYKIAISIDDSTPIQPNLKIYQNSLSDKKPILFKDTDNTWKPILNLRGIDENNCDIVDTVNNVFENNITEVIINGSESNIVQNNSYPPVNTDLLRFDINTNYGSLSVLCDKFKTLNSNDQGTEEGIRPHTNKNLFAIYIAKSKLETHDLTGFKKWLQTNNITILYKLVTSFKYEINPIFPSSYDNETMILFGSGVIAPYASWKITSHAANIIKNQGQRLTRLENDFYKYTVVQNRIMLDSRYAADNATFKIDTSIYSSNNVTASNLHASICEVKETHQDIKYDFDLYKLIKRNILVGKDNYDRAWMEECITFYWMDFKISDQMHAELNEIIENQYNPPVDMTPIEPPMEDVVEEIHQA